MSKLLSMHGRNLLAVLPQHAGCGNHQDKERHEYGQRYDNFNRGYATPRGGFLLGIWPSVGPTWWL
jgi:hypothetical protein